MKSSEPTYDDSKNGNGQLCASGIQSASQQPAESAASPPGSNRGGKHAVGKRVRDRAGENARRDIRMVPIGRCGKTAEQIRRNLERLRKLLENHVLQARNVITAAEQLAINQACRWEMAAQLAMQWLRNHEDALSASERLQHANTFASATANRDKAVDRLKLPCGGDGPEQMAGIYAKLSAEATEKSAEVQS